MDPPRPIKIFSREDWGAMPAKTEEPLKTPVKMVMMMDTRSEECYSVEECNSIIKNLQKQYMEEKNYDDIPWSFLVGGDGNVYEGRGWKVKPIKTDLKDERQAKYDGKSIDIAYIGDYQNDYALNPAGNYPSLKALNAGDSLLMYLAKKKAVDPLDFSQIDYTVDLEALDIR